MVLQREDTRAPKDGIDVNSLEESAWIAERIPDAKLVAIPGRDYLRGSATRRRSAPRSPRSAPAPPPAEIDRVLLAVSSPTSSIRASLAGSATALKELLAAHDLALRATLDGSHSGFINSTGDGVFAVFWAGPGGAGGAGIGGEAARLGLEIRAGVHAGEAEVSGDRMSGSAVHMGARIMAKARARRRSWCRAP